MEQNTKINCPSCETEINVNQELARQVKDKVQKEFAKKHSEKESTLLSKIQQLEEVNLTFEEKIETAKKEAVSQTKSTLERQVREEYSEEAKILNEELAKKTEQVKKLHQLEATLAQKEREKEELESQLESKFQKELSEQLKLAKKDALRKAQEDQELKLKEKDELVDNLKIQINHLKQKAEQGSMQSQGEVQELAIEEWLVINYPLDTINEVKKGANGGDCIQTINTRELTNCGTIYYESKNTKSFSPSWISKFKDDLRDQNANIGVIVTKALPNGTERATMIDKNLWVCTYQEFKSLSMALRHSLIMVSHVASNQMNKGDKMELLYDYLTGNEFRLQLTAIKDAFCEMENDLTSEIRVTQTRWKKRKKQIDKVMISTTGMYGSLRGIAGNTIPRIQELEDEFLLNE